MDVLRHIHVDALSGRRQHQARIQIVSARAEALVRKAHGVVVLVVALRGLADVKT